MTKTNMKLNLCGHPQQKDVNCADWDWFKVKYSSAIKKQGLGPVYTKCQRQRCDDACESVLIENKGVTWK